MFIRGSIPLLPKITVTGHVMAAADGKSRAVTTSRTTAKGKKFKNVAVFDRQ